MEPIKGWEAAAQAAAAKPAGVVGGGWPDVVDPAPPAVLDLALALTEPPAALLDASLDEENCLNGSV